jgi:hypothetical protein
MAIKLLGDYKGWELEALSDEAVQRIVDLECAEAGAPLTPTRVAPLEPFKHQYDVKLYKVGGLYVQSMAEAESLRAALRSISLWDLTSSWKHGYQNYAKPSVDELEISPVDTYSLGALDIKKDALARHEEAKKAHEKDTEDYDRAVNARGAVSESVWRVVQNAWSFKNQRERLRTELDRYIALADGDGAIGLRFFEKAYGDYRIYLRARVTDGTLTISNRHYLNPDNNSDIEIPDVEAA